MTGSGGRANERLDELARAMNDEQLRGAIMAIRGDSKRAGSRARRLNMAESLALLALMAEEARRAKA